MTTILHVITGLDIGGAEKFLCRLIAVPQREIRHVVVSLSGRGKLASDMEAAGIDVHTPPRLGVLNAFSMMAFLRRLAKKENVDLVQSWLYKADLFATLCFSGSGIPVLWNVRQTNIGYRFNSLSNLFCLRVLRLLSRFTAHTIVYCATASRLVHEAIGYNKAKSWVIPNGIDVQRFNPAPERDSERPLVINVARYDPQKGQADFIHCAQRIMENRSDIRFQMVGRGVDQDNSELVRLIRDCGLTDHIELLGERPDIPELLNRANLFLSCSHGEGFPNALAEAMACGLLCVATRVGDTELLLEGIGDSCDAGDIEALAESVCRLMDLSTERRKELEADARNRIVEDFSVEKSASLYADLYHSVARTNR